MDQYCCSPLSKRHSIRLLRLLPGKNTEILRCELFEYALRESGSSYHLYEALSYVWGSEDKPQSVVIAGQEEFKITQNLYHALHRLRNHSLH